MKRILVLNLLIVLILANIVHEPALAGQEYFTYQLNTCPCSIWDNTVTPTGFFRNPTPIELGLKFRSDVDGYILGVRFYKDRRDTDSHIGRIWSNQGTLLAENAFEDESTSGWQSVMYHVPIAITANQTYIASYLTTKVFSYNSGYFATIGIDNTPLHALANGVDGPNGVFRDGGGFPNQTSNANNYWVDIIFDTNPPPPDTQPPQIISRVPDTGVSIVRTDALIRAKFNEALVPDSVNTSTFELRDPSNNLISAAVTFDLATLTAILDPNNLLANHTTYTATLKGGVNGLHDQAGNPLEQDATWSFTTAEPHPLPPDQGSGGPILVISSITNPFSRYYAEILHAEGLNEFTVLDIGNVTPANLATYDLAILGEMPLTGQQVSMLSGWVNNGGRLIAMRPDKQLAGLLGISDAHSSSSNGYILIATSKSPGVGIVNQTMQFHGTADFYNSNGAESVAQLYSDAITPTSSPAVTVNNVGLNGGKAAAFMYDLARSVVYTRQGNPDWVGQHRNPWQSHFVALDLFYPDWINFNKITIPQADEQQRFFVNLITQMALDRKPLPRFWYFPRGEKAVVVMTGDDHNGLNGNTFSGNTATFFDRQMNQSPPGCSVDNWECVRSSSYMFTENPMSDAQAAAYTAEGFEVAVHSDPALGSSAWCASWTSSSLFDIHESQLYSFFAKYLSLPIPASERSHCYSWFGYIDMPKVQYDFGIRMDTSVPYWPAGWVQNRPGFMNGSGMPMRFADVSGNMLDVYQAHTIISDDNGQVGQAVPFTINQFLDWALGPEGYFGAFTINTHSDNYYGWSYAYSDQIVSTAMARGVPVVSARQMLTWLDGRNSSSFTSIDWEQPYLYFQLTADPGANGLQAMVPADSSAGSLTEIFRDGVPISYTPQLIKGINYAVFSALNGSYSVRYAQNPSTPTPTATATAMQTATPTPSPTPTATPIQSPDQIFSDGFESGNLGAWTSSATDGGDLSASTAAALVGSYGLQAVIDDNAAVYVTDDTPNAEAHYRARFYFDPNSISMANLDSHPIFFGYSGTSNVVLRLEFRISAGVYQIRVRLLNDTNSWISSAWINLSDAAHFMEMDLRAASGAGANNGGLTLWIDGVQQANLTGVDNDTRSIDRVQLGAVAGVSAGTRGTYYFDSFESRRHTYIGPAVVSSTITPTATGTIQGTPSPTPTATATAMQTATPTPSPTPTATPIQSPDQIFSDGFESGNLGAWTSSATDGGDLSASTAAALVGSYGLQAVIDDNAAVYVTDDTPNAEAHYRARFYFDPNSISMANLDSHPIFFGYSGTSNVVLRLEFRISAGVYQIRVRLLNDTNSWISSAWINLSDAAHFMEMDLRAASGAGANNGGLTLWIDGVQQANLTGVDNDTRSIDRVRLGAIAGVSAGTRGTYYFDSFESWR